MPTITLTPSEIKVLEFIHDSEDIDDEQVVKNCDLESEKVRKILKDLKNYGFIKGSTVDQGNWLFIFITTAGTQFIRQIKEKEEIEKRKQERGFIGNNIDYIKQKWEKNNHKVIWWIFVSVPALAGFLIGKFL